jgi:hypothetical protein
MASATYCTTPRNQRDRFLICHPGDAPCQPMFTLVDITVMPFLIDLNEQLSGVYEVEVGVFASFFCCQYVKKKPAFQ